MLFNLYCLTWFCVPKKHCIILFWEGPLECLWIVTEKIPSELFHSAEGCCVFVFLLVQSFGLGEMRAILGKNKTCHSQWVRALRMSQKQAHVLFPLQFLLFLTTSKRTSCWIFLGQERMKRWFPGFWQVHWHVSSSSTVSLVVPIAFHGVCRIHFTRELFVVVFFQHHYLSLLAFPISHPVLMERHPTLGYSPLAQLYGDVCLQKDNRSRPWM